MWWLLIVSVVVVTGVALTVHGIDANRRPDPERDGPTGFWDAFSRHGSLELGVALVTGSLVGLAILYATNQLQKDLQREDDRRAAQVRREENQRADERRESDARLENLRFVRGLDGTRDAPLRLLDLRGQVLDTLVLPTADLSGADLTEASLYQAALVDVDIWDGVFVCTDMNEADLSGGSILVRSQFLSADLRKTDLRRANLEGTVFGVATGYERADPTDLRGVDFTGARNLEDAVFRDGEVILDENPTGWPADIDRPRNAELPPERSGEQCSPLQFR